MADGQFRVEVERIISQLPEGLVTTYGDVAAMAGSAHASRIVGGIAHYGNPNLPWHRLVNRFGGLAAGFPGGREVQEQLLLHDGITCTNQIIDKFEELRWRPSFL
ncbi:MGMT family protein [Candidatus Saccharibacteria bacterium]|nr:MGMT family protein [Candidatus Saccharibacteria bacterium]MBH2007894.1 MGMT family protein [Candidatus Saccharibacteria bacterium]